MIIQRNNKRPARRRKRITHDIIVENWHTECHVPGSRLYKLTIALSLEDEFNDSSVVVYGSDDSHMLSNDVGGLV